MARPRAEIGGNEFERVKAAGLTLPGVEATTRYDGATVLKISGSFVAGLATHPSAEPNSLVVRVTPEDRELLLEDAPEAYYDTGFYEKYPLVLVRLSQVDGAALLDLLSVSCQLANKKARRRPSTKRRPDDWRPDD
jgi:hypothetical protein